MWKLVCSCLVQFLTALHLSLWLCFSPHLSWCALNTPGSCSDAHSFLLFWEFSSFRCSSRSMFRAIHQQHDSRQPTHSMILFCLSSSPPFFTLSVSISLCICHVFCIQIPDIFISDIMYVFLWFHHRARLACESYWGWETDQIWLLFTKISKIHYTFVIFFLAGDFHMILHDILIWYNNLHFWQILLLLLLFISVLLLLLY